ncbi:MAG: hypothetical protein RR676_05245 [Acinetobacter sp.]
MNIAQAICKKATFGWLFLWVCPVLNKGEYFLKLNCERIIGLVLNGLLLLIKLNKIKGMTGNIVDIKHQISLTMINFIRLYACACAEA